MGIFNANEKRLYRTGEDWFIDIFVNIIMLFVIVAVLYPVIYIFSNSISAPGPVAAMKVVLFPIGFSLKAYEMLLHHQYILPSYLNTFIYVTVGTAYSLVLTVLGAYPLSKRKFVGRNFFMFFITITMLFGGGMIPTYLVVNGLGLTNTTAAMILPCAVSAYYLILMRTSFEQMPESIEESAKMDGANDILILIRIHIPMNIPVIVTIMLFYMVNKWNDFFTALLYLRDKKLFPLQLILRDLLLTASDKTLNLEMYTSGANETVAPLGFRCAIVFISMIPMLLVYPFLQRYFIKGIMIGSIKG